jgi:cell division protein FtsZ
MNIAGGKDLTMLEVNRAAAIINKAVRQDANIIFGAAVRDEPREEVRVTVIATGFSITEKPATVEQQEELPFMVEENIDVPAVRRQGKQRQQRESRTRRHIGLSKFDLDVPAFMRRKQGDA